MKRNSWLKIVGIFMIACAATAFAADSMPVKGNPDTKVYHKSECRFYNSKGCTKEFKSEAEAVKSGYKPCKQCAAPKKEKKPAAEKK